MAHVLLFPFPAQGHVRAMLKMADLLHAAGFYVTFVNTERIHRRFVQSSPISARPKFRFRTIPDGFQDVGNGLTPVPDGPLQLSVPIFRFLELEESLRTRCRESYRELLVPIHGQDPDEWPPVACVLADASLPLAFEVAEESRVPAMLVATNSACSILAHLAIPELIKRGEIPFPEGADMDKLVKGVSGMESFLRRRDLPSSFREAKSLDNRHLRYRMRVNDNLARAAALILNTSECVDSLVLLHIRRVCSVTYTPGPADLLLKNITGVTESHSANLFQVDRSCMAWLDSQPDKSVVYVSFGSITVISRDTFLEFQHGLVSTGRRVLWVIRRDLVEGGTEAVVGPAEERFMFVEWAPQVEVLLHPAVGCFVTHCGWNSTLESLSLGVPMVCWPFFTDQLINSRFVSEVWAVGVDMKDTCERKVVERMVRRVMDGEEGEVFGRAAGELTAAVRSSAEEGGSSYASFTKLVQHIKSFCHGDEASK